jgi:hypothetical protein
MCLLLGSVVGCVAGLFAGGLVGSAGVAFAAMLDFIGILHSPLVHFLLLVGTILGSYFSTGWVSAWCTTRFGEWGKNRNKNAAVLLSVIASIIPVVFAWVCYYKYIGSQPLLEKRAIRVRAFEYQSDTISVVSTVFGLVIAPAVAGFFAASRVGAAKFCENCKSFMRVTGPKSLRLGCLRAMVRAVRRGRIDLAAYLLQEPCGVDGEVRLYSCRCCSRGYLEVTATYKAVWEGKGTGGGLFATEPTHTKETWLAASCELAVPDVERLREGFLRAAN